MTQNEDYDSRFDEISDHPVSPLEGMSTGIGSITEKVVSVPFRVAGAGLHVAGKILGKLFG